MRLTSMSDHIDYIYHTAVQHDLHYIVLLLVDAQPLLLNSVLLVLAELSEASGRQSWAESGPVYWHRYDLLHGSCF